MAIEDFFREKMEEAAQLFRKYEEERKEAKREGNAVQYSMFCDILKIDPSELESADREFYERGVSKFAEACTHNGQIVG